MLIYHRKLLPFLVFLSCLFATHCYAFDVTLKWDFNTEPELLRYEVFSREEVQSYDYNNPMLPNPATPTEYQFSGLVDDKRYYFVVKAVYKIDGAEYKSLNSREVSVFGPNHRDLGSYNSGWGITEGDLAGFMILYDAPTNPNDTPTLGPSNDIPPIPGVNGVGVPLNLQPSGLAFNPPVTLFIPCPTSSVNSQNIYYWDNAEWILANDADDPNVALPGAENWMEEGTRVDHDDIFPYTIEIKVNHFSGAQAGTASTSTSSSSGGGGGGGCFIATAARKD